MSEGSLEGSRKCKQHHGLEVLFLWKQQHHYCTQTVQNDCHGNYRELGPGGREKLHLLAHFRYYPAQPSLEQAVLKVILSRPVTKLFPRELQAICIKLC